MTEHLRILLNFAVGLVLCLRVAAATRVSSLVLYLLVSSSVLLCCQHFVNLPCRHWLYQAPDVKEYQAVEVSMSFLVELRLNTFFLPRMR